VIFKGCSIVAGFGGHRAASEAASASAAIELICCHRGRRRRSRSGKARSSVNRRGRRAGGNIRSRRLLLLRERPDTDARYSAHRWSGHLNLLASYRLAGVATEVLPSPLAGRPCKLLLIARRRHSQSGRLWRPSVIAATIGELCMCDDPAVPGSPRLDAETRTCARDERRPVPYFAKWAVCVSRRSSVRACR